MFKSRLKQMIEAMEREGPAEDTYLNDVEVNLTLPKAVENRLELVVCKPERDAFLSCKAKYGIIFGPMCFVESLNRNICYFRGRSSEDIKDDCTEEYLALRSHYRLTKDPETLRKMKAMILPRTYGS